MVRGWIGQLPAWLEVHTPVNAPDALLVKLDSGERDAILLAGELRADQLVIDDRQGRHEAEKRGILSYGDTGRIAGSCHDWATGSSNRGETPSGHQLLSCAGGSDAPLERSALTGAGTVSRLIFSFTTAEFPNTIDHS